jgi:hypothetical protein|uniref:Uncharacterized protein n=1 Tax=viral metagenome TaxID=1070528 RepID=A0A6C0CH06_9ZZZZ
MEFNLKNKKGILKKIATLLKIEVLVLILD